MSVLHQSFMPTGRAYAPKSDVLTATLPVTASLYLGSMWFADFEASVSVYRDEADEVMVGEVAVIGLRDKREARTTIDEAPRGFSVNLDHYAFDAVMDECRKPAVRRQMEEAMASVEREREL